MLPVKCLSSSAMTSLLEWRNAPPLHPLLETAKIATVEVTLILLNTVAVVETVVYGILALVSKIFASCDNRPYLFFAKLLDSSALTIFWTWGAIIMNFIDGPLLTKEAEIRREGHRIPYLGQHIQYRPEDRRELGDPEPPPPPVPPPVAAPPGILSPTEEGARLLVDHVCSTMEAETLNLFKEMDAEIFLPVCAKVVFLYTVGALRNEPLPGCIRQATRQAITGLRAQCNMGVVPSAELTNLFNSQDRYNQSLPLNHPEKPLLNEIIAAAGHELQGSRHLLGPSWQRALQLLP
jgi:hypothetical protein